MLDAVGIKLLDASAPRAEAQQDSASQEQALPAGSSAAAGAGGPYYSPVLRLDVETQRTVIQYRDVATGKVQIQYPSERQLEAYRASQRQRRDEAAPSDDGREPGRGMQDGRLPEASAALRRASASVTGAALPGDRGGPAQAGTGGGGTPADANRPTARPTAITA